jgi:hypothetical protein
LTKFPSMPACTDTPTQGTRTIGTLCAGLMARPLMNCIFNSPCFLADL